MYCKFIATFISRRARRKRADLGRWFGKLVMYLTAKLLSWLDGQLPDGFGALSREVYCIHLRLEGELILWKCGVLWYLHAKVEKPL